MTQTARYMAAALVTPHESASTAGRDVLAQGGSALEAALAALAVTSVVQGHICGPGGDSIWLVREPGGRTHVIDAAGSAGAGATLARYHKAGYDEIPQRGPLAILATPGTVAGMSVALDMARAFGGRMPLVDLFAPAVKLGREGFAQSAARVRAVPQDGADLASLPGFADAFLQDGEWPQEKMPRRAEKHADTLEQLAHAGLQDFYRGDIARELAHDLERIKSPLLRADLARYEARVRKPLVARNGAWTCLHAGPPGDGLSALLSILLHAQADAGASDDFASLHALIEAAKHAASIARPLAIDPRESEQDPAHWLSPATVRHEALSMAGQRASAVVAMPAASNAAFIGAIDPTGLAVACISTLHADFGSGCVLPRTGVLMGNRGAAFSLDPASPFALAPGLRTPRAPSPALAVKDEGLILAYGAGATAIDLQIFARIAAGMDLAKALDMPRFAFAKDGRTWLEDRIDPTTLRALERAGHELSLDAKLSAGRFGMAGALLRRRDSSVEAAGDPRGEGAAEGL